MGLFPTTACDLLTPTQSMVPEGRGEQKNGWPKYSTQTSGALTINNLRPFQGLDPVYRSHIYGTVLYGESCFGRRCPPGIVHQAQIGVEKVATAGHPRLENSLEFIGLNLLLKIMSAKDEIKKLAIHYSESLSKAINSRVVEMERDDISHYLLYRVLGIAEAEGKLIDVYQNKGRFLYKYAGSFLEAATKLCFREAFPDSGSLRIPNTRGERPKTFEIDCLVGTSALEIKWKDATTDGDHITKEHTRIKVIAEAGHTPIRITFYYPNRTQAIRIQETLKTLYEGIGGQYYYGEGAWNYVKNETTIDLKGVLEEIAAERVGKVEVLNGT